MIVAFCALCASLALSFVNSHTTWANSDADEARKKAAELLTVSQAQSNHLEAVETAKQALALYQSANDTLGLANTYEYLGDRYFAQSAMTEAAQYYELALQAWRQQSDVKKEAVQLTMLGFIEGRRGEWLNGISYLTQAQNLIDEQNDFAQLAMVAAGMGFVLNESGLPQNGLTQYQRAMEYYGRDGDLRKYNRQIMMVGYTNFLLGNYPVALTNLKTALAYFEPLTDRKLVKDAAECHEYLGQVYFAMGQYDLALQHLEPIPAQHESTANYRDAAQVRALIGQIYERRGALDRARAIYLDASKVFAQADDRVADASVRFALGRLELSRNHYDAAESYLKESIKITEDIRHDLKSRLFAAAFSANVHERYEAYIYCLMRKHDRNPAQGLERQAFEASELARARSLAELLRDTQTKVIDGADPNLIEQERTLRKEIQIKVEQTVALMAGNYKKDQLNDLETTLTHLREQHKLVVGELQKQNPRYDQIKETTTYSVQQVQESIVEDDQTMLLEYFLGKNASYVWAIKRNDIKVFKLPKADDIDGKVRVVYDLLSNDKPDSDSDDRLNKASTELSQMVLGPLAGQLNAGRLIVVADGALNYIPFQLLPNPDDRTPLVAKYEIVNAPSASILGQLRQEKQQRSPKTKVLAAFGDPVFPSNYEQFKNGARAEMMASNRSPNSRNIDVKADVTDPSTTQSLIYTKFELKKLSDIAGPGSLIATGFNASRSVLETTEFSNYAILHIATHGVLDRENPEKSGFLLSLVDPAGNPQKGFITMQDVYDLKCPVDLVVLSACRTGLGKDMRGEGLIGLTRGFMHAGASSVVASLWKVDDEATSELMKYFYANMLQQGMPPAKALRAAQNTLRQNSQWQSPHFWAGFTLQGEFREPIRLPVPAQTGASLAVQRAVGGGLLLTLLAGIAWGYWRRSWS